ncbi:NusG domain II-containing protein [Uliginosibacterium sediminicola]|uniref:NusG domain II-containing protein n=1 Tax=Uliginosibacterium sediminicola TaxID=2024550 RepID=A0ABU9YTV4_9RHOO
MGARDWLALAKPGDYLVFVALAALTALSCLHFWSSERPSLVVVRAKGKTVASLPLDRAAKLEVRGPLGITHVEVEPGRARVAADPGPRQYCVKQGWLTRAGAIAICAPNEVSVALEGGQSRYDSMSY